MAGRMVAVALAVFAFGLATDAVAQDVCASNQAQLAQAITDSRSALDRVSATLDGFARDLIGPRTGALDAGAVTSARSNLDAFISALREFSGQVRQIGLSCGPQFASDAQTLEGIVGQFEAARQRADTLLADHQALVSSGEPAMTQAQMACSGRWRSRVLPGRRRRPFRPGHPRGDPPFPGGARPAGDRLSDPGAARPAHPAADGGCIAGCRHAPSGPRPRPVGR
jgi:hypothetical protein